MSFPVKLADTQRPYTRASLQILSRNTWQAQFLIVWDFGCAVEQKTYFFWRVDLVLPVCGSCGEKVFTEEVLERIQHEFRKYLKLLTPSEIRAAFQDVNSVTSRKFGGTVNRLARVAFPKCICFRWSRVC